MSQQTSIVLEVMVERDGRPYVAPYFVEHGVIHAKIGDRVLLAPLVGGTADEMVRALLCGHLDRLSRMSTLAQRAWVPDGATGLGNNPPQDGP